MPVTIAKPFRIQKLKPKMYFVSMLYEKHISWEFSVAVLMEVFRKDYAQAVALTDVILTQGEAICGVYMFDVAETKATTVEEQALKEGLSMRCLIEEI